jgi:hypothetical protein
MEKITQQGALCSVLFTKYHLDKQFEETEMGTRGEEKLHRGF